MFVSRIHVVASDQLRSVRRGAEGSGLPGNGVGHVVLERVHRPRIISISCVAGPNCKVADAADLAEVKRDPALVGGTIWANPPTVGARRRHLV